MMVGYDLEKIAKWLVLNEKGEGVLVDNAPGDIKEKYKKLKDDYEAVKKMGFQP